MSSLLSFCLASFFSFLTSGSESTSDLELDIKLFSWLRELLFFISESFWLAKEVLVSWENSLPWLRSVPGLCALLLVGARAVSNILQCIPCRFWWWVSIRQQVLLGSLHFAIDHYHSALDLWLTRLGATDGRLETTEAFLAEWRDEYLTCEVIPDLWLCLFLVLPALSELEFSDCIFESI